MAYADKQPHTGRPDLAVEPVMLLSGGGVRIDVTAADGRQRRVDVQSSRALDEIVTTLQDRILADREQPDWLDDVLMELSAAWK